jgi:phage tail sheath gpL-like
MATVKATQKRNSSGLVAGNGLAYTPKVLLATIALPASASGTIIDFGNIPSNARIMGISQIMADDLATSGSPTLDLGFQAVNSNITTDPDALNDGLAVSSALAAVTAVKGIENRGKMAWEYVASQTTDPGGLLTVIGTIKDAATNAAGDVTLELLYYVD